MNPELPSRFLLTITFDTDWHIGCGAGRPGDLDRLVDRDADGLPYLPAKTLTGVWRDACETVARGLDGGRDGGDWSTWVTWLFGSEPSRRGDGPSERPVPAALSIRAGHFPTELRDHLSHIPNGLAPGSSRNKALLRNSLTFSRPGNAIDPLSGRARDDFLRFEERVRKGAVLQARCQLPEDLPAESRAFASALLLAGARFTERMGGKRRRGTGRCRFEVERGTDSSSLASWLRTHLRPDAPPASRISGEVGSATPVGSIATVEDDAAWITIPLRLRLVGPVVVASRVTGNVVETLDYIPGTMLLPYLTTRLNGIGYSPREAVARGDLRVLPATVEVAGERGAPVPRALRFIKDNQADPLVNPWHETRVQDQLKPCRQGYGHWDGQTLLLTDSVNTQVRTHSTIAEEEQRPTARVGGVFSYQALAAGLVLRTEVRLKRHLHDGLVHRQKEWWNQLEGECRIGRSKKDDYGQVSIALAGSPRECPSRLAVASGFLTVHLLSDVLLRDTNLGQSPRPVLLAAELEGALKPLKLILVDQASSVRRLESWSTAWGLPRPSLPALQAGSCLRFKMEGGKPNPMTLALLQAAGIGERRSEGFGDVCFNPDVLQSERVAWSAAKEGNGSSPESEQKIAPDSPSFDFARQTEEQTWISCIDRAAREVALLEGGKRRLEALGWQSPSARSKPGSTQLGGLRATIQRFAATRDPASVIAWLDHLESTSNRKDKWPNTARAKLRKLLNEPDRVWQILADESWPELTDGGKSTLRQKLWPHAVHVLIEECIRAHKRACERVAAKGGRRG